METVPKLPEFWIDVGGTFTDCLMKSPEGSLSTFKLLSSGVTKGTIESLTDEESRREFLDTSRTELVTDFWAGYQLRVLSDTGDILSQSSVVSFLPGENRFLLEQPLHNDVRAGMSYELFSHEDAPLLAIRCALGLKLLEKIPPVNIKLGTTRGTNALLTRTGAATAFVTTKGFGDVLLIGNQDRPKLFELNIQKPQPLYQSVVEIDERLDASGNVLKSPDRETVRKQLKKLKQAGIESVAICLLHSFANSVHEEFVTEIAAEVGFEEISVSSWLSPLIKLVSRGETTVVDAYLNPILRTYVSRLLESLPGSSLKLMTSAGGLVDARNFVGKDSILSGPAGGVIGFSRVAELAGFPKSIGFDMGGTSTDVARYSGTYEREFETTKAGVRVVAPMLAIETVAAGGGSLCTFDGVQLRVGPESAGADPGPACYGKGGGLTVTDLNLYLGKILPRHFPFSLNRSIVEKLLTELCEQIAASPLGKAMSPHELAEGFLQIANANMVRAIRNVSVAKGFDPATHLLVTFGGAGGQHACEIARALGMKQILIHPYAGILSAYGIGLADVRRFGERAVLQLWNSETQQRIEEIFQELECSVTEEVLAEGVSRECLTTPERTLEMRYHGLESTLLIPEPADGDFATAYANEHERSFGYKHEQRDIEIVNARLEIVGKMPEPEMPLSEKEFRQPNPSETTTVFFSGQEYQTGVFHRNALCAGDTIDGPAIICEPTSTVVISPGFQAEISERGDILLTDSGQTTVQHSSTEVDPVLLEIFNNLFASIAEQMGITLQKTSVSTNVKERLDFSCAVFSPEGNLVVNAPHIPVHLGAMSETVKRVIQDNPKIFPGDVFVTNDPYRGGSHLPDITVITPIHNEETHELIFWTASRAHHAEIGGIVPGSMPPFSKNLAEEGVLIQNVKLVDRGVSREAELRELLLSGTHPTRNVNDNLADIAAQVAANNNGMKQLRELVDSYSLPVVQAYLQHIQHAATEKMRLALAAISDGKYQREDCLDDGSRIMVTITIKNKTAIVDFTGTDAVLSSNLNANRAIVSAAVMYVFRCLIADEIPLNSGVLEPITILLPECLLNPPEGDTPEQCAAMVGGNVETSQRVVDLLLGALELAAASQGTMNNLTFGDETFGYYETICGGSGATASSPGADAVHTHMTNTRLTDVEVLERRYPVRIQEFSIRYGSGGAGQFSGGAGITRRLEFLKTLNLSILSERRTRVPFGLQGGEPGESGSNLLIRAKTKNSEDLGGKVQTTVSPGDLLIINTPGGGGFGIPPGELPRFHSGNQE